jgi:hypothetical protein
LSLLVILKLNKFHTKQASDEALLHWVWTGSIIELPEANVPFQHDWTRWAGSLVNCPLHGPFFVTEKINSFHAIYVQTISLIPIINEKKNAVNNLSISWFILYFLLNVGLRFKWKYIYDYMNERKILRESRGERKNHYEWESISLNDLMHIQNK